MQALSKIKNYQFKLVIVGDGPERIRLTNYAEKLLPNRIIWKGTLKCEMFIKLYLNVIV